MRFFDRREAGRTLATLLSDYAGLSEAIVLGLPRGGIPVAFEVAKSLHLPLDVFIVRKLGVPGHEELAMGAIASGDVILWNEDVLRHLHISQAQRQPILRQEQQELFRRETLYRGSEPPLELEGKIVILVDDGLATGATMKAAAQAITRLNPKELVIAVPVGSRDTCQDLERVGNRVVCGYQPRDFQAVGLWYNDFSQTSDEEVQKLLSVAASQPPQNPSGQKPRVSRNP